MAYLFIIGLCALLILSWMLPKTAYWFSIATLFVISLSLISSKLRSNSLEMMLSSTRSEMNNDLNAIHADLGSSMDALDIKLEAILNDPNLTDEEKKVAARKEGERLKKDITERGLDRLNESASKLNETAGKIETHEVVFLRAKRLLDFSLGFFAPAALCTFVVDYFSELHSNLLAACLVALCLAQSCVMGIRANVANQVKGVMSLLRFLGPIVSIIYNLFKAVYH